MPYWLLIVFLAIIAPGLLTVSLILAILALVVALPLAIVYHVLKWAIKKLLRSRNPVSRLNRKYLKDRLKHL